MSMPLLVDAAARTARADLPRRVALCSALLARLGQSRVQKNWSPFSYGGRDYVVYSISPLRVWRVDHRSGECEVARSVSSAPLDAALAECNSIQGARRPEQQRRWRRCTGAQRPFPAPGKRPNGFHLALGGGTPGILVHATGRERSGGGGAAAEEGEEEVIFAGHSRLLAASPALLEAVSPTTVEVGPEREWHASYNKLYRMFFYALRPRRGEGGEVQFELSAMSQLFSPPTRTASPKIVFPTGLLPPQPTSRRPLLTELYGELDVFMQAWGGGCGYACR